MTTDVFIYPGEGDRFTVLYEDVTERKRAETALRESEQRFRALAETSPLGVGVSSTEGKIIYTNRAYAAILGYEPGDLLGQRSTSVYYDPADRLAWLAAMQEQDNVSDYPVRFRRKDDSPVWVSINVATIEYGGRPAIIGVIQYITARKQAEERQAFLLKLSDTLRPLSDPLEIQRAAMQLVGEHLQVDRALYNEIRDDGETIHIDDNYVRGDLAKVTGDFAVRTFGAAMDVLRRGEVLVIEDQRATPLKMPLEQTASTAIGVLAIATVPLVKAGRWVANFGVLHGSPRKWAANEIAMLQATAERTWDAVQRARRGGAVRKPGSACRCGRYPARGHCLARPRWKDHPFQSRNAALHAGRYDAFA